MPAVAVGGVPVAGAEVASTVRSRLRGLLGRDRLEGALVLPGVRGVHTLGMRFPIDVAYVDRRGRVLAVRTMRPWRVGRSRWRAAMVVEAAAGTLAPLGVVPGARLEVLP